MTSEDFWVIAGRVGQISGRLWEGWLCEDLRQALETDEIQLPSALRIHLTSGPELDRCANQTETKIVAYEMLFWWTEIGDQNSTWKAQNWRRKSVPSIFYSFLEGEPILVASFGPHMWWPKTGDQNVAQANRSTTHQLFGCRNCTHLSHEAMSTLSRHELDDLPATI